MKLLDCLLIFLFASATLTAQTLSGRITDASTGEPLPYASIYVQQTGGGATSNENGLYQVKLKGGTNRIVFQYLGYQTQVVEVSSGRGSMDIELVAEALDLQQVEILSGAEDLSYSVIRRAIAKADYHRNQLDSYTADVYLKGKGMVDKVPKLYMKFIPKEDRVEADQVIGRNFTSESFSKVTYTRPNTYSEEVVSKYEVGDNVFSISGYVFSSFYSEEVAGIISPLSPKSFAYYKFEHEGVFVDQDKLINKIKVIPRSRGEDVFEGYVYIVQDDWSLHSLELRTYRLGFTVDLKQNYNEVKEHVWMPITTTIDGKGGILGVKFSVGYIASVSNYDIKLNPELKGYVEVIDEKTNPDVAAATRQENRVKGYEETLQNGGELTLKEMRKLMRTYEKEEQEEKEEPEVVANYTFEDDSVKVIRDTALWAAIRPIPLTEAEVRGYEIQDSIAIVAKADSVAESLGQPTSSTKKKRRTKLPRFLRYEISPEVAFNPVEGYAAGLIFGKSLNKKIQKDTSEAWAKFGDLEVKGRYGFAWKRVSWEAKYANWHPSFKNNGRFYLKGGRYLRQFDPNGAIDPYINAFTSLVSGNNYINLYERAYGEFGYSKRFSDAFELGATFTYEDRRAVENNTNNSWFQEGEFAYSANAPVNVEAGLVDQVFNSATAAVTIGWKPGLKYIIRNGRKRPLNGSAPDVTFRIVGGFPEIGDSKSDFALLEAAYAHRFRAGRKATIQVMGRAGSFINREFVDFPDYKHFATSEILLTRLDPIGSYRLLPYYANSTAKEYVELYGHYQFRKFLLTQIWELHLMGLKEDLFVNYLYTPDSDHYTEVGYSIDNILRVLRLEFVTSFRDGAYEDFGVRLSITTNFSGGDDD